MRIGLDLDNTIVCYDRCFHTLAVERCRMPSSVPPKKNAVRQFLREAGREPEWTELQGVAYGTGMEKAEAFSGALEFVRDALACGVQIRIISHRTKHPIVGDETDLHESALGWLQRAEFVGRGVLRNEDVFFETTKEAKLARIAEQRCGVFLDDLPELLMADSFPPEVEGWLFAPGQSASAYPRVVRSWAEFGRRFL